MEKRRRQNFSGHGVDGVDGVDGVSFLCDRVIHQR